jgi:hypothetical protein
MKRRVIALAIVGILTIGLGACSDGGGDRDADACAAGEYGWASVNGIEAAVGCDFGPSVTGVLILNVTEPDCAAVHGEYREHDIVLNDRAPDVTVRTRSCFVSDVAGLDALTAVPS